MLQETRCLSFHGQYQCRHSGACCTAGWPIPVEANQLARLRAALATGALSPAASGAPAGDALLFPPDAPSDTPALAAIGGDQACVFYESTARRCRIHRALDHEALPLACRQFPRVIVHDPRGVSVTLSHYCPTAASMLDTAEPVRIVTNADAFPASGEYVGLDVNERRAAHDGPSPLPPFLRPDVLMDWESWWEWERLSVDLLANADEPAGLALGRLGWAVERSRDWRPDDGPLIDRVRDAFNGARHADARPFAPGPHDLAARVDEVTMAIPEELRPAPAAARAPADQDDARLKRFLAAHAFANWTAHLGQGLRTLLRSVEAPFALLRSGLDVRAADLRLRHLADPSALTRTWTRTEQSTPRP